MDSEILRFVIPTNNLDSKNGPPLRFSRSAAQSQPQSGGDSVAATACKRLPSASLSLYLLFHPEKALATRQRRIELGLPFSTLTQLHVEAMHLADYDKVQARCHAAMEPFASLSALSELSAPCPTPTYVVGCGTYPSLFSPEKAAFSLTYINLEFAPFIIHR